MKWLVKGLGTILALLIVVVAAAAVMLAQFDPNDHKDRIEAAITQAAGRDFKITGPIKATYFPVLGFDITGITMDQPYGYGAGDFMTVKNAQAGVKVTPLFKKQIEITKVTLNEPVINIVKQANGGINLKFPSQTEGTQTASTDGGMHMDLSIEKVEVNNARLTYKDTRSNQNWVADSVNLTLPGFKPGATTPIKMSMVIKGADAMEVSINASGTMEATPAAGIYILSGMLADIGLKSPALTAPVHITLGGDFSLEHKTEKLSAQNMRISWQGTDINSSLSILGIRTPRINFNASADSLDLDSILVAFKNSEAQTNADKDMLPYPLLRALKLDGAIKVGTLKFSGLNAQNLSASVRTQNNVHHIDPITAEFYDGTLSAAIIVNPRKTQPSFSVAGNLTQLEVGKLLQDKMGQDYLSGKATFAMDLKAEGYSVTDLRRASAGSFSFDFGEGYINKWQLSKRINQAISYFETGTIDENASDKIYFTSLDGKFIGQNGIFTNDDLIMLAPKSHALGNGQINLAADNVDYNLRVGLGDDPEKFSTARHIPIHISGPLKQPQYGLDLQALVKEMAGEKIEEKKEELLNKAFEKLGGDKESDSAPTPEGSEETTGPAAEEEEDPAKQLLRGFLGGG